MSTNIANRHRHLQHKFNKFQTTRRREEHQRCCHRRRRRRGNEIISKFRISSWRTGSQMKHITSQHIARHNNEQAKHPREFKFNGRKTIKKKISFFFLPFPGRLENVCVFLWLKLELRQKILNGHLNAER